MRVSAKRRLGGTFAALLIAGSILFFPAARPASAQCGTEPSSCKTCHVTEQQSVPSTNLWHTQHSTGDFCAVCHAGDPKAADKAAAHTGLRANPLSDVQTSCENCHPGDCQQLASTYTLAGGSSQPAATPSGGKPAASSSLNLGNLVLAVLIMLVALGGGAYVYNNERHRRQTGAPAPEAPSLGEPVPGAYPETVLALLPQIARLDSVGLEALSRLLRRPEEASELLFRVSRIDPALLRRLQDMEEETRELLAAMLAMTEE
jgi:hypothetical protein